MDPKIRKILEALMDPATPPLQSPYKAGMNDQSPVGAVQFDDDAEYRRGYQQPASPGEFPRIGSGQSPAAYDFGQADWPPDLQQMGRTGFEQAPQMPYPGMPEGVSPLRERRIRQMGGAPVLDNDGRDYGFEGMMGDQFSPGQARGPAMSPPRQMAPSPGMLPEARFNEVGTPVDAIGQRRDPYDPDPMREVGSDPMATDPYNPDMMPGMGADPRGMFWQEGRTLPHPGGSFQPGAEYQTADLSNLAPSGVGETSAIHATARAFQGLMKGLDDYERLVTEKGTTARPGKHRDDLSTAHYDLLLQMKELYNLGVLNGPDLQIMQEVLLDPTAVTGNALDLFGGDMDMEKRIPANIDNVRRMMRNRAEPALQQIGVDPSSLMPKTGDDALFEKYGVPMN